ncbi:MAG TPA: glycerophosphodiester phosphodiesterase family protein [Gemmataceae bacterium]|nr:glycerophosphodiester phosphodiesterase family protein [Gemmataceae bacterium]
MPPPFELQGHRGARGLKPENTLPGFETALDLGVTSVETDVHLTRDAVPVLMHDPHISERLCRLLPGATAPDPAAGPAVASLTLAQLRGYRADRNPAPGRFPQQDVQPTPLALAFAGRRGIDAFAIPTLAELFDFVREYAGAAGEAAGKSAEQRRRAESLIFDLELKRVPFRPESVGDDYDGESPGLLERRVVEAVRSAGVAGRVRVRSFDHRSVAAARRLEPALEGAVLVQGTAPVRPADLAQQAGAAAYCPDFAFVDAALVRQCHAQGVRVLPWTVNEVADAEQLLAWGVGGATTDYPDRLGRWLRGRGLRF